MHEHFNAVGNKTGHTVVTRESMWSEGARARVLALVEYEDSLCKCGCGLPVVEAHRKGAFVVHEITCWAGRAIAQEKRRLQTAAEDEAKRAKRELDPGWNDGKHYHATVHEPES